MVRRAAGGGEIPAGAEKWIREITKDAGSRTAGERNKTGFVGRLFGLDRVPGLTKTQSDTLKKQGLITAGLTMLGSPQRASTAQALASGIFAARADVAQTAGELLDVQRGQQQLQAHAKILNNPDLNEIEKWKAVREAALASGDTEGAELATDVITQLSELSASELDAELVDVNGDGVKEEVIRGEDGSLTIRDPFTKETLDERPAAPVDEEEAFKRTDKLADDFRSEAEPLIEARRIGRAALEAPPNAASDQTLVVALNKLIDPNSVVRQSEFVRTAEVGGLTAQAQQFWNRLQAQGEFSAQTRELLRDEIARLEQANQSELQAVGQQFRRRAQSFGVNPDDVVRSGLLKVRDAQQPSGNGSGETPVLFPELEDEEDEEEGQ